MKTLKHTVIVSVFILLSGFCTLNAGVIDDLAYTPENTDVAFYFNYADAFKYIQSGGINPEDIMLMLGEQSAQQIDDTLKRLAIKITDIKELLVTGSLSGITRQTGGFIIFVNTGGKGTIPQEFMSAPLKTDYGTVYLVPGNGQMEMCFLKSDQYFIIGDKPSVIAFLKKKSLKAKDAPVFQKNFIKNSQGKIIFFSIYLTDVVKQAIEMAVAAGAGKEMEKIKANYFIKSMMAVKSIDFSVEMRDGFVYTMGMYGVSGDDAERLVMVSHCFIVNTSLIMTFADIFMGRMNNPELQAMLGDNNSMQSIQLILARAKVKKTADGVLITTNVTKEESDKSLADMKALIDREKAKRAERLESEKISLLTASIINGDTASAEKLLSGIKNVNIKDLNGDYPLAIAAMYGDLKIMKALVVKGAKIDLTSTNGNTALHLAVSAGMFDAAVYLVEKGANVNTKNDDGMSPLYINASQGDTKITMLLLRKGAEVNAVAGDGYAPIHRAAESGNLEVIKVLVQFKADVEIVNGEQERAIDIASRNGFEEIVDYFRKTFNQEPAEKSYEENEEYNEYDSGGDNGEY